MEAYVIPFSLITQTYTHKKKYHIRFSGHQVKSDFILVCVLISSPASCALKTNESVYPLLFSIVTKSIVCIPHTNQATSDYFLLFSNAVHVFLLTLKTNEGA